MCPSDPRSRIILHMNWRGQTLPVLMNGLPCKDTTKSSITTTNTTEGETNKRFSSLPQPSAEQILQISPYAQIIAGNSRSPTYLVHGTEDDLIPWRQSQRTYDALVAAGVSAGISILQGEPHLFDLFSDGDGKKWEAVVKGYDFLFGHVGVGVAK